MTVQISDIGHVISLAIAPVFLLSGVGTMLMVMTNRLARIIDRARMLEDRLDVGYSDEHMDELDVLYQRSRLINIAIALSTACALLVCLVIAMLFVGDTTKLALGQSIAACFVISMAAQIGSFVYLLREILIASKSLRWRRHVRAPTNT